MSYNLRKRPAPAEDNNDIDTDILAAELLLEDIQTSNATHSRTTVGSSRSAPDCYLDVRVEDLRDALQHLKGHQSAPMESSERGRKERLQVTLNVQRLLKNLALLAEAELDDHRAALALSRGETFPAKTEAQKALENAVLPDLSYVPSS
ncbi:hypothetical protein J3A83DRAFT_4374420 [Scleroderma citrinum]